MSQGNLVQDSTFLYAYDAWGRLVEVRWRQDDSTLAEYRCDGLGRRIAKVLPDGYNESRLDYYYNERWQVLEERLAYNDQDHLGAPPAATYAQYVWDARYIDAPVVRWRDSDDDEQHTLDETLYYTTDANMNVTALIDGTPGSQTHGQVVERYVYDPYGKPTIFNADWSATVSWDKGTGNDKRMCGWAMWSTASRSIQAYSREDPGRASPDGKTRRASSDRRIAVNQLLRGIGGYRRCCRLRPVRCGDLRTTAPKVKPDDGRAAIATTAAVAFDHDSRLPMADTRQPRASADRATSLPGPSLVLVSSWLRLCSWLRWSRSRLCDNHGQECAFLPILFLHAFIEVLHLHKRRPAGPCNI